jgi:ribonucleases P/MRP protein subunit RPP40
VPQGSVLGSLLLLIYINDLDGNIISQLNNCADDTKICRGSNNEIEVETLQKDLNKIYQWSIDWQMLFNMDKFVIIHAGKNLFTI